MARTTISIALIVIGILSFGCSDRSAGYGLFMREKCIECHTIKGKGGAAGPNLTTIGKKRDRAYLREQIKNPASHNQNTAMPSFKHLPDRDLDALADYLANLK